MDLVDEAKVPGVQAGRQAWQRQTRMNVGSVTVAQTPDFSFLVDAHTWARRLPGAWLGRANRAR